MLKKAQAQNSGVRQSQRWRLCCVNGCLRGIPAYLPSTSVHNIRCYPALFCFWKNADRGFNYGNSLCSREIAQEDVRALRGRSSRARGDNNGVHASPNVGRSLRVARHITWCDHTYSRVGTYWTKTFTKTKSYFLVLARSQS